ncbi:hypothetical protein Glove_212g117 [Diversispora epigaea]|uniref:Uncharacterized protein n=1 Tax=Diversispora epigaea TaxID=1348612 RepID=A0A397IN32_9GLOM|nr:hypothetical protein Glove_212g117 [Diversispora epigaea]
MNTTETEVASTSKAIQTVQNDSDNDILDINIAPNLADKASQKGKGKGSEDVENGSDIKDDGILTPELEEVYKKLDRRQKERYQKCRTEEAKIVLLETTRHERKKGKYEIASVFNAISVLTTIAITVTAKDAFFINKCYINIIIVLFPTYIGITLAIILGIFIVSPAISVSWIGVGASISTFFFEIIVIE